MEAPTTSGQEAGSEVISVADAGPAAGVRSAGDGSEQEQWSGCIVWHDVVGGGGLGGGGSRDRGGGGEGGGRGRERRGGDAAPGLVFNDTRDGFVRRIPHERIASAKAHFDVESGCSSFVVHYVDQSEAEKNKAAVQWVECRVDGTVAANRWAQELEQRARRCDAARESDGGRGARESDGGRGSSRGPSRSASPTPIPDLPASLT